MILAYIADVFERVNIRRTIHEAKSTCRLKSKNNVFLIKVYFSIKVKYLKVMYGWELLRECARINCAVLM